MCSINKIKQETIIGATDLPKHRVGHDLNIPEENHSTKVKCFSTAHRDCAVATRIEFLHYNIPTI